MPTISCERDARRAEDLPVAGHAGRQVQAAAVQAVDLRVLVDDERARADEAHLAAPDVEELRQLVERGARAGSAPTRVIRGSSAILNRPSVSLRWTRSALQLLGVRDHRAELEDLEAARRRGRRGSGGRAPGRASRAGRRSRRRP